MGSAAKLLKRAVVCDARDCAIVPPMCIFSSRGQYGSFYTLSQFDSPQNMYEKSQLERHFEFSIFLKKDSEFTRFLFIFEKYVLRMFLFY